MTKRIIAMTKKYGFYFIVLVLLGLGLAAPRFALGWPSNHLDDSTQGGKPYCMSCHSYNSGYLNIETIRGKVPTSNKVTVNKGGNFEVTFRTQDLGYGRFTVSGAVQVPDTSKWILSETTAGDTPWFIAAQTTINGANPQSPIIWSTDFPAIDNPNAQRGVTIDNGLSGTYTDRNLTAHDEAFSVKVTVGADVSDDTYFLKFWGIGTTSAGVLGYNEQILEVIVSDDITPPSAPTWSTFDGISTSTINVKWNSVTDTGSGTEGYEVYRAMTSGGPYEYIGHTASPNLSFPDSELLDGTTYYYKVATVDNAGNVSPLSSEKSATTIGATPETPRNDTKAPLSPTGIHSTIVTDPGQQGEKAVEITWNANKEADVVGYYVYRSTSETGTYVPVSSLIASKDQNVIDSTANTVFYTVYYVDTEVKYGSTYYYKVKAIDLVGKESLLSSYTKATPTLDSGLTDPHGNYAGRQGMCQNCHSTHSSRGRELILETSITDACYSCHDGTQSKYNIKAQFDPVANPSHHRVPEGRYSCDVCHNPHYSAVDNPKLLSAKSREDGLTKTSADANYFCWACHGENSDLPNPFGRDHKTAFLTSKHGDINYIAPKSITNITCLNCHNSHGARDFPLLVSSNSANFCILCHKDSGFDRFQVLDDYDAPLVGVTTKNFSNEYYGTTHEIQFYGRNTCTVCHEPHGHISNRYMLLQPYNDKYSTQTVGSTVYGPVEWANNAQEDMICFRCHDSQYYVGLGGNGSPTIGSRFGNGSAKNLHDHVTDLKVSCRACHDPHSGTSEYHTEYPSNTHYVSFDWAKVVGILSATSHEPGKISYKPAYDINLNESGFSCALTCHNFDHWDETNGAYKSYFRTDSSPELKCAACHDYDRFDTNSRHPVLYDDPRENKIECNTCHIEDHSLHTKTNPYGLKSTIVTNWTSEPSGLITTNLANTYDPITGQEVPAYGEFCWQCHGTSSGPEATRAVLGDKYTHFKEKPHALLQREGNANPYGAGLDSPCLTCHTHHNSTNIRLLRTQIDGVAIDAATSTGKINACMACHDGYPGRTNIASKYNAESSAGHFIKNDPTKKLLCTECHSAHGTTNLKYMLDSDPYNTGVVWPANRDGEEGNEPFSVREFCLVCHPYPTGDPLNPTGDSRPYNTENTIGAGTVQIEPMPGTVDDHWSNRTDGECAICHDPHKPWPATGGADKCFDCHSRPNGEATDIKSLTGLTDPISKITQGGLPSKHLITDGDTVNNTCMQRCHLPHPHAPNRKDHLKSVDEKELCLGCHDHEADPAVRSPYTIDRDLYNTTVENPKPHDYYKPLTRYMDDSNVLGNCDKCHTPHGSNFDPLLRARKDELCVGCHDGVTTDQNGDVIEDIKTMYTKAGHSYVDYPEAKLYCDECHVPHGSSSDNYLRDDYAPRQTITYNGSPVAFPSSLIGGSYDTRTFCVTCHLEYTENAGEEVVRYVYYASETAPGGEVAIRSVPLVGDNGVTIIEHTAGQTKGCAECHNPHDPEPVGNDKDCFVCHGATGYAYRIEPLTGLAGVFPDGQVKASYHPINDPDTVFDPETQTGNDCMRMCHSKHTHNPRADLLVDRRSTAGDTTAPAKPASVTANATSGSQVDIEITASTSSDVFGYNIYKWNGSDFVKYGVVNSTAVSPATVRFYDGGLQEDVLQRYKVVAFDKAGNPTDEAAALAAATEISATPAQTADTQAPDIPTNLTATVSTAEGTSSTRVIVSWSPSKDNYITRKYNIYRSPDNVTYTLVGTTGYTSFADIGLEEDKTYYYKVTAVDTNQNESAQTAEVSVTTTPLHTQVQDGSYWSGSIDYQIMRTSDQVNTTVFMNGNNVDFVVETPPNYFGNLTVSRVDLYPYAVDITDPINSLLKDANIPVIAIRLPVGDTFKWTVPMPTEGSLYTAQIRLSDGSRTLNTFERIMVAPTVKRFDYYTTSARTEKATVFTPGSVVYYSITADAPGTIVPVNTWEILNSSGAVAGTLVSPSHTYDTATGTFNGQFTLPSGLSDDTWYTVRIKSVVTKNTRKGSRTLTLVHSAKQLLIRAPDVTPPGTPGLQAIVANNVTPNSVPLSWNAASGDPVGYAVKYRVSGVGNYLMAGSTTSTEFTVTGLSSNTSYDFQVVAFDAAGNETVTPAQTTYTTKVIPVDSTPPSKPINARTVTDSPSTVSTFWSPNSVMEGVTGYAIYRSTDGVTFNKVGVSTTTSFTDEGLRNNTLYYYQVRAYDRAGNLSIPSDIVSRRTKRSGDDSVEGALCMSCHSEGDTSGNYVVTSNIGTAYLSSKHNIDMPLFTFKDGSVYEGNCLKCHAPHGSDWDKLLRQEDDNELCFLCHSSASVDSKYSGRSYYEASSHGKTTALGEHSSTPRYMPSTAETIAEGLPTRTAADAGKCYNCHAPHGKYVPGTENTTQEYIKSSAWRGTSTNLNKLCYTCHTDANKYGVYEGISIYEQTKHGDPLHNSRVKLDESYGAGECTNCHDPHGTQYGYMLKYPFNEAGTNKNKLCLTCHDQPDIVKDTGLFKGSRIYNSSAHGIKAKWLESYNVDGAYNKTEFLPGVCLNCHNSHGDTTDGTTAIPKMLVMNDGPDNEICNKCHDDPAVQTLRPSYPGMAGGFELSPHHANPGALWPGGRYYTEPQSEANRGKCINCHDPHGTARPGKDGTIVNMQGAAYDEEEELCYTCHRAATAEEIAAGKSAPASTDLAQFRGVYSGHMPWVSSKVHTFGEDLNAVKRHVECQDCHNVHLVIPTQDDPSLTVRLSRALKGNWGVDINSWPAAPTPNWTNYTSENPDIDMPVATTGYGTEIVNSDDPGFKEYMLCFKCHSTYAPNSGGKRIVAYMNPNNASSHGWDPGRTSNTFQNPTINQYQSTLLTTTIRTAMNLTDSDPNNNRYQLTCSDCHGNGDATGPKGPHGSNYEYLLKDDYKSANFCLRCHNWTGTGTKATTNVHRAGRHSLTSISGPSVDVIEEIQNNFTARFGSNYCRFCHFAGSYIMGTKYASVHGENAVWNDPANGNSIPADRGMNGYYIRKINFKTTGSGTCYMTDPDGYYCKHGGATTY